MGFFDKIFGKSSQSKFSHQKKTVLCPIDGKVIRWSSCRTKPLPLASWAPAAA